MKNTITTVFLAGITLSSVAMADWPAYLSAGEIVDCMNNKGEESNCLDYQYDYTQDVTSIINKQEKTEIGSLEADC